MKRLVSAIVLFTVNLTSRLFFRTENIWIGQWSEDPWRQIKKSNLRVIAFLNHTSLYEPVFTGGIPWHFLWFMAGRLLVPGADKTLKRPLVGTFYKLLTPATVSITRKRDTTWESFLSQIAPTTVVMLAAEGRMKRRNGLDSRGQPMSVRGGVGDVLNAVSEGSFLICYSGGLHHVQAPGEHVPRLFKTVKIAYEMLDIATYKKQMEERQEPFKLAVARDLELRMQKNTPESPSQ